jgi:hypothetical protein
MRHGFSFSRASEPDDSVQCRPALKAIPLALHAPPGSEQVVACHCMAMLPHLACPLGYMDCHTRPSHHTSPPLHGSLHTCRHTCYSLHTCHHMGWRHTCSPRHTSLACCTSLHHTCCHHSCHTAQDLLPHTVCCMLWTRTHRHTRCQHCCSPCLHLHAAPMAWAAPRCCFLVILLRCCCRLLSLERWRWMQARRWCPVHPVAAPRALGAHQPLFRRGHFLLLPSPAPRASLALVDLQARQDTRWSAIGAPALLTTIRIVSAIQR